MQINKQTCVDCEQCATRCPVGAIRTGTPAGVQVDLEECVECGACLRSRVCPTDSLYQQEMPYPRSVRSLMSDPLTIAPESGISGRGTEEMKTNDVTGRFKRGYVGIAVELGRPGIATRLADVEKVAMAVVKEGVEFEKDNPITSMMANTQTGKFKDELLNERVLSGIVEVAVPEAKVPAILRRLQEVAPQLDTVFSLCISSKVAADGSIPHTKILDAMGLYYSPNGKHNLGLGKPAAKFA